MINTVVIRTFIESKIFVVVVVTVAAIAAATAVTVVVIVVVIENADEFFVTVGDIPFTEVRRRSALLSVY